MEIVRALIAAKAPLNHVNNLGWTALLEAVVLGNGGANHTATVEALVKGGADIFLPDRHGTTALGHARTRGYSQIARILENAAALKYWAPATGRNSLIRYMMPNSRAGHARRPARRWRKRRYKPKGISARRCPGRQRWRGAGAVLSEPTDQARGGGDRCGPDGCHGPAGGATAVRDLPVFVENRAGAGTTLGAKAVASVSPTATRCSCNAATLAIGPTLYKSAGYDPLTSFAPVAFIASVPTS